MACRKFLPRTRIGRVGFVCGLKRGGVVGQVLWKPAVSDKNDQI